MKKRFGYFCGGCLILLSIVVFVVTGFVLEGLVRSQAEEGVKMTPQTYKLWGIIPGDSETFTLRNFTIFNFTNPQQFLYRPGTKPSFVEVGGFLYQEKSQFLNRNYSKDKSQISFDYWLYFPLLNNSRNVDEKFTVMNVGPLGFWMQLDTTTLQTFTLQGLGSLFIEMNATIKPQAIGQGISSTFLPSYEQFLGLCKQLNIAGDPCWLFWNDPIVGLNDQSNYPVWIQDAYYQDNQAFQFLSKHLFPYSFTYLPPLRQRLKDYAESMDDILSNWYCGENANCGSTQMTIKQIATGKVTGDPPAGSDPEQSICSTNQTCIGYPQIPVYLKEQFKKQFPDQKYQALTFSEEWIAKLMTPYENLLNIGFLNQLFKIGFRYDSTHDETVLNELKEKIEAQTKDHAFVIWQWLKYFTNEFVLKLSRDGTRKIAGLGGVFSQAIYEVNYAFASWFLQDIHSFMAYKMIGDNCLDAVSFLPSEVADKICSSVSPKNYTQFYQLIEPCLNPTSYETFKKKYGIERIDMKSYCDMDEDPSNLGKITLQISKNLSDWYGCLESLPTRKCTQKDIITKQIFNSQITKRPYRDYPYPQTITAHDWNSEIPAFQYQYYLNLSGEVDLQPHLQSDARDLFSFDKLLNGPAVQELFIQKNQAQFMKKYHWSIPALLRNYIRFVVIQVGFGGLTQQRSAKEIFFGYDDPFLAQLRDTDPLAGGDPSIQSLIAFNEPNLTKKEAPINPQTMISGIKNPKKYRQFVSLYNKSFISVNQTYFDGKNVGWEMITPWAEQVTLQGSDGFAVPPNLDPDEQPVVYISSIARFANVTRKQTIQKFGLDLYDMRISKEALQSKYQNPYNEKYYQTFASFLNSSYQGFPLFVSKNHFLGADPKWAARAQILDERGNVMKANDWDDTRLYVEPYTGTALSATVYLQSNYYYLPDILFPQIQKVADNSSLEPYERMLPVVNTFRSGNVSEAAVDKYWGELRTLTKGKRNSYLFGILLCCFGVIMGMGTLVKERVSPRQRIKPSLLQSESMIEQSSHR